MCQPVPADRMAICMVCVAVGYAPYRGLRPYEHSFPNSVWDRPAGNSVSSAQNARETEFRERAFPNGVWERGRTRARGRRGWRGRGIVEPWLSAGEKGPLQHGGLQ